MRYLPLTPDDRAAMLAAIGAKSVDDLFVDVPQAARRGTRPSSAGQGPIATMSRRRWTTSSSGPSS